MVYKFKIWFEEDDEIIRWIDIQPKHTFLEFHNIILDSLAFDKKQLSSFYLSDDNWRKGLEITLIDMGETRDPKILMENSKLKDFINDPHQKFIYITDFLEMWTLNIELQSIQEDVKGISYPFVSKSVGIAPKQNDGAGKFKIIDQNEFDDIAIDIMAAKKPSSISDSIDMNSFAEDLDLDDAGSVDIVDGDDDDDEDEESEFGDFYGDEVDESDKL